jgi:pyroglutamyl-peptidase
MAPVRAFCVNSLSMRFVITGFDPFNKSAVNPSQLAVEGLPDTISVNGTAAPVTKLVLPTCCGEAVDAVQAATQQLCTDEEFFVLLSGLADKRESISLERFALNVREYRIADNRGHRWQEEHLEPGAPDALRTSVPLGALAQHLQGLGYKCEISNHAGTFVCNETYFRALRQFGQMPACKGVLFVHFPRPRRYAKPVLDVPDDMPREERKKMRQQARENTPVLDKKAHLEIINSYTQLLVEIAKFVGNST